MKHLHIILKITALILIATLISLYMAGPDYPGSFEVTDVSDRILFRKHQDFSGATLINLDGEEDLEIFISGFGSNNLILKRDRNNFRPLVIPELVDADGLTFSVTACDIDGDGRDEMLLLNRPGKEGLSQSKIMKYVNGNWEDIVSKTGLDPKSIEHGYSATCIDRKGDGLYGLAVAHDDGHIAYLEMTDGKIRNIADSIGLKYSSKGRSILGIPGPLGYTNIFLGNESGPNFYFVNTGDGVFIESGKEAGLDDPDMNARGVSIVDVNEDDIPDMVYGNHVGPTRLMQQTREGKFVDVSTDEMKQSYAVNAAVVGDFNLDGYEDIYLNNFSGANTLFSRFGQKWFMLRKEILEEKDMPGISSIAADLDNDGEYEILNTHGGNSVHPITMYSVKASDKWIKFDVRFENGGIPRGAIIRARTTKRDQLRVISSGSGRFANYDNAVLFGLLKEENIASIEVILPSGKKIEIKNPMELNSLNKIRITNDQL